MKSRRSKTAVLGASGGTLSDYVPFYFAPRSPMLYVNHKGGVGANAEGQEPIVHLVACLESLAAPGRFVMTDGHPATPLTTQFETLDGLDQIDWPIMRAKFWADTDDDGDRRRRRQAEFLVHRSVPFSAISIVGTFNEGIANRAATAMRNIADTPSVVVRRDWYY